MWVKIGSNPVVDVLFGLHIRGQRTSNGAIFRVVIGRGVFLFFSFPPFVESGWFLGSCGYLHHFDQISCIQQRRPGGVGRTWQEEQFGVQLDFSEGLVCVCVCV